MVTTSIQAHIFYRHDDPREVAGLGTAIIPLYDHIKAVASGFERSKMKQILGGEYFRLKEAQKMLHLLRRATRHARANLSDYFPLMREGIMDNAERLEVAIDLYWDELKCLTDEVTPNR